FLMSDTMTRRMAPPTPPPATLPRICSTPPPETNNPIACRRKLPSPPPKIPASELPRVPRLLSCIAAPAMLPPTAPLIKLTRRLVTSRAPLRFGLIRLLLPPFGPLVQSVPFEVRRVASFHTFGNPLPRAAGACVHVAQHPGAFAAVPAGA